MTGTVGLPLLSCMIVVTEESHCDIQEAHMTSAGLSMADVDKTKSMQHATHAASILYARSLDFYFV